MPDYSVIYRKFWPLAKRILFGAICIFASFVLSSFQYNVDKYKPVSCNDVPNSTLCTFYKIITSEFSLSNLSILFLVIGVFLIFLYTFFIDALNIALEFALSHATNASAVVQKGMETNRFSKEESRRICTECLTRYAGYKDEYAESISIFLVDYIINQSYADGGYWRKNYISDIVINTPNNCSNNINNKYLQWQETSRFTLCNSKPKIPYIAMYSSTIEVDEYDLEEIVRSISYTIKCDGLVVFDIKKCLKDIDINKLRAGDSYACSGLILKFFGSNLEIEIKQIIIISKKQSEILHDEKGLISKSDNFFALRFYHPTEGMQLRFTLPYGFSIRQKAEGTRSYGNLELERIHVDAPDERLRIDYPHWCFPGIAAIITWTESVPKEPNEATDEKVNGKSQDNQSLA